MLEANKVFVFIYLFQANVEKIHLLQSQILNLTTSHTDFCSCWKVSNKINTVAFEVYVQHKFLCLGYASYKLSSITGGKESLLTVWKSTSGIILVTP